MDLIRINLLMCFTLLLVGCIKEENFHPSETEENYTNLISNLNPHCPDSSSESSFTMLLNNHNVCYYDGVEGKVSRMQKYVQYTTPGPSIVSNSQTSDVTNNFVFGILKLDYEPYIDDVRIHTPKFQPERDPEAYLDSIFSIKNHKILSKNGDDRESFEIELHAGIKFATGGLSLFKITTSNGPQAESSLVINEVRKLVEDGVLYYDLDISLNCVLYHWSQTGRTGVFARLENGRLVSRFKPEFY
ncbi:MAG: hypothetical protein U0V54_07645 [Saprospiraceae bacterium]